VEEAMNCHFEGCWDLNRSISFAGECIYGYNNHQAPQVLMQALGLDETMVGLHIGAFQQREAESTDDDLSTVFSETESL
jgi:hypothetical protein